MDKIKDEMKKIESLKNEKEQLEEKKENLKQLKKEINNFEKRLDDAKKESTKKHIEIDLNEAKSEYYKLQEEIAKKEEEIAKKLQESKKPLLKIIKENIQQYKTNEELEEIKKQKEECEEKLFKAENAYDEKNEGIKNGKYDLDEKLSKTMKHLADDVKENKKNLKKLKQNLKEYIEIESHTKEFLDLQDFAEYIEKLTIDQLGKVTDNDYYKKYLKEEKEPAEKKTTKKEPAKSKATKKDKEKEEPAESKTDKEDKEKEEPAESKTDKEDKEKEEPAESKTDKEDKEKEEPAESKTDKEDEEKEEPVEDKTDKKDEEKEEPVEDKTDKKDEEKEEPAKNEIDKLEEKIDKLIKERKDPNISEESKEAKQIMIMAQLENLEEKLEDPNISKEDKEKIEALIKKTREQIDGLEVKEEDNEKDENSNSAKKFTADDFENNARKAERDIHDIGVYTEDTMITYETTYGGSHKYPATYKFKDENSKKEKIQKALSLAYDKKIDFESEEGIELFEKYEKADPNIISLLAEKGNVERLEEYGKLLARADVKKSKKEKNKEENPLEIEYDLTGLAKSGMTKAAIKELENYAYAHRHIATIKTTPLQSIRFAFRPVKEKLKAMKDRIANIGKTKALGDGKKSKATNSRETENISPVSVKDKKKEFNEAIKVVDNKKDGKTREQIAEENIRKAEKIRDKDIEEWNKSTAENTTEFVIDDDFKKSYDDAKKAQNQKKDEIDISDDELEN